ncbi:hypothetical protein GCM10010174_61330 [Kutzneria viridogrisea]|uniref:RNA polymerase-binding protein RbpA n=1 Tax=Kutzneria viridogrisea TaxID=47990 RepID=A0ABR6BGD8_9PSEU|nr:hypothetical protein [Kutzneria viridogrisea]
MTIIRTAPAVQGQGRGLFALQRDDPNNQADRFQQVYRCPGLREGGGHEFRRTFAVEITDPGNSLDGVPEEWDCPQHGVPARRADLKKLPTRRRLGPRDRAPRPTRSNYDDVLARRTVAELEEQLTQILADLRSRNRIAVPKYGTTHGDAWIYGRDGHP